MTGRYMHGRLHSEKCSCKPCLAKQVYDRTVADENERLARAAFVNGLVEGMKLKNIAKTDDKPPVAPHALMAHKRLWEAGGKCDCVYWRGDTRTLEQNKARKETEDMAIKAESQIHTTYQHRALWDDGDICESIACDYWEADCHTFESLWKQEHGTERYPERMRNYASAAAHKTPDYVDIPKGWFCVVCSSTYNHYAHSHLRETVVEKIGETSTGHLIRGIEQWKASPNNPANKTANSGTTGTTSVTRTNTPAVSDKPHSPYTLHDMSNVFRVRTIDRSRRLAIQRVLRGKRSAVVKFAADEHVRLLGFTTLDAKVAVTRVEKLKKP